MRGADIIRKRYKEIVRQYHAGEATVEQLAKMHKVPPDSIRYIIKNFDKMGIKTADDV